MTMHRILGVAAALAGAAGVANAQTFLYDFEVEITTGFLTGETYQGQFQYTLTVRGGNDFTLDWLTFEFFGESFTDEDDVDFPGYPRAVFDDGDVFQGIDYIVDRLPTPRGLVLEFGIFRDEFYYLIPTRGDEPIPGQGEGVVTYSLVPTPGAITVAGLALLASARRRRS
ncbi:MAG: hypothetical protein EA379_05905 [Phycisphaerales bacterium]|nr:MAG: hypothetical protein EA379_05905 [Phycisphaerales bacterium]